MSETKRIQDDREKEEMMDRRVSMTPSGLQEDFEDHLRYTLAKDRYTASDHDRYFSLALAVRDRLVERWIKTQQAYHDQNVRRVNYLSLEFLMGRLLGNNVINLQMEDICREAMDDLGFDWNELRDYEVDAGLGNGGLGRLAACFLDSMSTLRLPAVGYGLRYDYGIFNQKIVNGYQVEEPDPWLQRGYPWEIARPDYCFEVRFGGRVEHRRGADGDAWDWVDCHTVMGMPYDMPVVGYGAECVNTLRLWSARAAEEFDLDDFNRGSYVAAVENKVLAENLTKVLYPNDNVLEGKELRLKQQYFFVSCSLQDIVRRFLHDNDDWSLFQEKTFIQLNDTHPSLAIPEQMRILMDEHAMKWDRAWSITTACIGYTNHTILPEALEKWQVPLMERLLPRHLQIIYEINARFMRVVATRYPMDAERLGNMSIIEEGHVKQVRMANLAIVGSCSVNGVAELHSKLIREIVLKDFAELWPDRFNNKTNGITPRRWLLKANPSLAELITEKIGDGWVTDLDELRKLEPFADDADFRRRFRESKQQNKRDLADYIKQTLGIAVDPESIFDVQVKRLHEYKRQLLLVLYAIVLFRRIRENPALDVVPRTIIFGAKAAPGYYMSKLIIKLIHAVGEVINNDTLVNQKLKIVFLPNYRVSLAEKIIPAANLSEQISLAGTEASGTGNMKFQLNGALTIGTLDGANVEIREEVGDDNIYIFGMRTEEVAKKQPSYNPWQIYNSDDEVKQALDLIKCDFFSMLEPGIFQPIIDSLLNHGDTYMLLEDLRSYIEAQEMVDHDYRHEELWDRKAIINVARSGKFSSDRTITEYARDIWHIEPCDIPTDRKRHSAGMKRKKTK
jgi:starch phosphorylase